MSGKPMGISVAGLWTREWVPNNTVVLVVGVLVIITFSNTKNFSLSRAIGIILRLLTGDNIHDFRTVSDVLVNQ